MGRIERKILNSLNKEDKDLEILNSYHKLFDTTKKIQWLLDKNYIKKSTIQGSNKISITTEGITYLEQEQQKQKKRLRRLLYIFLGAFFAVLLPFIFKLIEKKMAQSMSCIETNVQVAEEPDSTFFLKNALKFKSLIADIELESEFVFSNNSKKVIEISFSGELLLIRENYFYYPGGYLIIRFNGKIYNLESLIIERTIPSGTLENEINSEMNRRLIKISNDNYEIVGDEIISILNENINQ